MKKFNEILDEISATRAEIDKSEAEEKRLTDALYMDAATFRRMREANDPAELEQRRTVEAQLTQTAERTRDLHISVKLLTNNAKLALFAEVMPVALEVLAKYKGKPYGEKTREKIREEMKNRTGCNFWISTRYSSEEYHISPVDRYNFDITVAPRYQDGQGKRLLIDNKIQAVEMADLFVCYINKQYFEDIPEAVREIREAYDKARAAQEALEAACSEFNKLSVDGLPHLSSRENIYPRILV